MRIAIDASRANLEKKTGVEWYSHNLIQAFKKIDRENQYFLYSQNELKGSLSELPDNFYTRILSWDHKKFWTQLKLWWNVNYDNNRVLFIPSGMIPLIPFRTFKLVTTIHDTCFFDHPEYYSRKDLFLQKIAFKFGICFSNKIITVSEFSKQQIIKYSNCNSDKISVTHLGYDKNIYKKIEDKEIFDRMKKKYNLPDNFVLYIGRIEDKKNILNQIRAFVKFNQKYPDFKFVLIGKSGYGYNSIKTSIFEEGLQKNLIELGYVNQDEIVPIINMAKVFMFVSNYEGFGIPIIEAMRCGTPVITSTMTSIPEVAGDAALYSEPNNTMKICENLCNIIENKDGIKDELIQKGFERSDLFSWEKCANETLVVINQLRKKTLKELFFKKK